VLLFHFAVDPLAKTLDMDDSTISFTITWRNQKILLCLLTAKTHLASWNIALAFGVSLLLLFFLMFDFIDALIPTYIFQLCRISQRSVLFVRLHFYHYILYPTEFDNVSGAKRISFNAGISFVKFFGHCEGANQWIEYFDLGLLLVML
jgi:hypothetical protein